MVVRRWSVREGVRPRKLVLLLSLLLECVEEESLMSDGFVGIEGSSSSTGEGSTSCIGAFDIEERVVCVESGGGSGLEVDIVTTAAELVLIAEELYTNARGGDGLVRAAY